MAVPRAGSPARGPPAGSRHRPQLEGPGSLLRGVRRLRRPSPCRTIARRSCRRSVVALARPPPGSSRRPSPTARPARNARRAPPRNRAGGQRTGPRSSRPRGNAGARGATVRAAVGDLAGFDRGQIEPVSRSGQDPRTSSSTAPPPRPPRSRRRRAAIELELAPDGGGDAQRATGSSPSRSRRRPITSRTRCGNAGPRRYRPAAPCIVSTIMNGLPSVAAQTCRPSGSWPSRRGRVRGTRRGPPFRVARAPRDGPS